VAGKKTIISIFPLIPRGHLPSITRRNIKQGVCQLHYGLAIYIKKYLKPKEELWKMQIFHHAKIYNLQELL